MVIGGTAHVGVCVPDVEEAVSWYRDILGMRVLSPPYLVEGPEIERDMGEMIPGVRLKGAIVGFESSDHVLELIEYPSHPGSPRGRSLTDTGISHMGLLCDDLPETRAELERKGVRFLMSDRTGAGIAGLHDVVRGSLRRGVHPDGEVRPEQALLAPAPWGQLIRRIL